jgi:hypothetical protein
VKTRIVQSDAAPVASTPTGEPLPVDARRTKLRRALFLVAVVGYVLLGAVHPIELAVGDDSTPYLAIHLVQPLLILLFGWGFWLLVEDVPGRAAQIARLAILPYAIAYSMFDALAGVAIGQIVREASSMSVADAAVLQRLLDDDGGVDVIGTSIWVASGLAWFAMAGSAALALRRVGGFGPTALMLVGAAIFAVGHPFPPGPVGIALFGVGLAWLELRRAAANAPAGDAALAP